MNIVNELREISKINKLDKSLKLKIVLDNDKELEGMYSGYTQALDNEPEVASISINADGCNIEILENEIKSIYVL